MTDRDPDGPTPVMSPSDQGDAQLPLKSEPAQEGAGSSDVEASSSGAREGEEQQAPSQDGWGWAGWLPSSAVLQQAAAGALRDVQELKESLQQVAGQPFSCPSQG